MREVTTRLGFLVEVGLAYLNLDRESGTLSGGESQRIRLAAQIGSRLAGVLYVLDEPSIGLHQRDNDRLIATLRKLRDLGNSVIVVEHDEDTIRAADYLIDIGPGAGPRGGTPRRARHAGRSPPGRKLPHGPVPLGSADDPRAAPPAQTLQRPAAAARDAAANRPFPARAARGSTPRPADGPPPRNSTTAAGSGSSARGRTTSKRAPPLSRWAA